MMMTCFTGLLILGETVLALRCTSPLSSQNSFSLSLSLSSFPRRHTDDDDDDDDDAIKAYNGLDDQIDRSLEMFVLDAFISFFPGFENDRISRKMTSLFSCEGRTLYHF
jgi:hypothetical protein